MTSNSFFDDDIVLTDSIWMAIKHFYQQKDSDDVLNLNEIQELFKNFHMENDVLDLDGYIKKLSQEILVHVTHLTSPTFIGHMTSRLPNFMIQIAALVIACNQNLIKLETSKALTFHEKEVIAKLHCLIYAKKSDFYAQHIQNHSNSLGFFTSGGTMSNITAIYTALNASVNYQGSRLKYWLQNGYEDVVIIGSELLHYSFEKCADLLGLSFIQCRVNHTYQIDITALEDIIQNCHANNKKIIALVGVAGATDFGSVDDLNALAEIAQRENIHLHVDAAWGGAFILSETHKKLLTGIELADTVTLDGHKQLMLPLGSGLLFFKNPDLTCQNMHYAPYAVRKDSIDIGRFTLEGSRTANSLYLDAALNILGKKGYDQILTHSMSNTKYMLDKIKQSEAFELIYEPCMNILLYRYIPKEFRNKSLNWADNQKINQLNTLIQKKQKERGNTFVSRTFRATHRYLGQKLILLRAVLFNPLTQPQHIDLVLQEQIDIAHGLN